mgnify:CR=1 FL=1
MTNRQERRRVGKKALKLESQSRVYITLEDEFLDCMGDSWQVQRSNGSLDKLNFSGVLQYTLRRIPVKTVDDSDRSLEILRVIQQAEEDYLEIRNEDYEWFIARIREYGHVIWPWPDAALIREYLKEHTSTTIKRSQNGDSVPSE